MARGRQTRRPAPSRLSRETREREGLAQVPDDDSKADDSKAKADKADEAKAPAKKTSS